MGSLGVAQVEDRRALEGEERDKIRASSSSKSWRGRKEDREDPWGDIWQRTPCEPNAQTFWFLTASLVFHHFRIRKYRPIPFRPDLTQIWPTHHHGSFSRLGISSQSTTISPWSHPRFVPAGFGAHAQPDFSVGAQVGGHRFLLWRPQ
ncbi:hypothetical protein FA13DRAFT_1057204 [Coprinellus micaceus]|nr:hypothetical protein FA13DRAFT_1057204 [Coprinellus micaceus]